MDKVEILKKINDKYEILDETNNSSGVVSSSEFFESIDFQINSCEEAEEDTETLASRLRDYNNAFQEYLNTNYFEYTINDFTYYINAE